MERKLLIIGVGGHGKVVAEIALQMNVWSEVSFLDDQTKKGPFNLNVIGTVAEINKYIDEYEIFIAIGNNELRKNLHMKLKKLNARIPTLIHPSSIISRCVHIGIGTVIMPGTIINPYTTIGEGCIVNTGATIDHDCQIGDFVHISPGVNVAGTVKIGSNCWIGIGSVVSNNIEIVSECNFGAGAVVIHDIQRHGTYVGVPVRRVKD